LIGYIAGARDPRPADRSRRITVRQLLAALADVRHLAMPYFRGNDRFAGRLLLGAVIALELAIVALNVLFNQWNARFYNAIQDKDWDAFQRELLIFTGIAVLLIAAAAENLELMTIRRKVIPL
jgi:putative ATP-binding cassette transporter